MLHRGVTSAVESPGSRGQPPPTFLILTAAIGSGHEAAGQAARDEHERAGHSALVIDGLRPMSPTLERLLRRGHSGQLRHAPWLWGLFFALLGCRPVYASVRGLVGVLYARRLARLIAPYDPCLIVSTYPLVTAALGRLRRTGRLRAPVVALISDYGVHPLWVAPGVDLHLVASRASVELAERAGGRARMTHLPTDPRFRAPTPRPMARARLGIPPAAYATLIVGGAWGVGDLEGAACCALAAGTHAIVVTGHNTALRRRLAERFGADERVSLLGWTEDMPGLMRASDCVIQNAGGMTCVEALTIGLPIVFFKPIPGHGRLNARIMQQTGAVHSVGSAEELTTLLDAMRRGTAALPRPRHEAAPALGTLLAALPGTAQVRDLAGTFRRGEVLAATRIVVCATLALMIVPGVGVTGVRDIVRDLGGWVHPVSLLMGSIAFAHALITRTLKLF